MVHWTFVFARPPFWGRTGCQKVGLNDGKMKLKQWYNFLLEENSGCNEEVPVLNIFTFLMEFYLENIHDLIMEIGPWLNATESRGNAPPATRTQAANSPVKRIPWQTWYIFPLPAKTSRVGSRLLERVKCHMPSWHYSPANVAKKF